MNDSLAFAGSVPENYDKYLGPFFFEPYAVDLIDRLKPKKLRNVLELACGTGRVTKHLVSLLPADGKLIATDLNPDMISVAKARVTGKRVHWQVVDAQELPFEDNIFDHVVCQFGVMFFQDKLKAFSEAHRVLKNDGVFLFNTWDHIRHNPAAAVVNEVLTSEFNQQAPDFFEEGPFSLYDQQLIRELLTEAGFIGIEIEEVKIETSYADVDHVVSGFMDGSPLSAFINEKDASVRTTLKKKLLDQFIQKFGDQSSQVPLQAIVCQAIK